MRSKAGLFDAIIVLAGSSALALFLLWLASELVGLPILDRLPPWLEQSAGALWALLTGGSIGASLLKRYLEPDAASTNFLFAIPVTTVLILVSVLGLGEWLRRMEPAPTPEVASGPRIADLSFELELTGAATGSASSEAAPVLSFAQQSPKQSRELKVLCIGQVHGAQRLHIDSLHQLIHKTLGFFLRQRLESGVDPCVHRYMDMLEFIHLGSYFSCFNF